MKNKVPYKVGDIVTDIRSNLTGAGILWRIHKIKGQRLTLKFEYSVTGHHNFNDKRVDSSMVAPVDFVELGLSRMKLDRLISEIALNMINDDNHDT